MIRKARPPLVIVEWFDAASSLDDCTAESVRDISRNLTFSVGWLLKRTRKGAYLVTDWLETGEMRVVHFLPGGMIRSVRTVRTAARKTKKA